MVILIKAFQRSRTGHHGYSICILSKFKKSLPWLLWSKHFGILEVVTMLTLVDTHQHSRTGHHGYSKIFQHSRSGCRGYSRYIISAFYNWLPWFLLLKHFNISEMVIMVSLIISFQHSRTGYHWLACLLLLKYFNSLELVTMCLSDQSIATS